MTDVNKTGTSQPADPTPAATSAGNEPDNSVQKLMGDIEGAIAEEKKEEVPADAADKADEEGADAEEESEETTEDEKKSEDDDEDDSAAELPEDAIKDGEIKGLPAEVQEKINRKIGKTVAKRKAAEERAAAAEAERDMLKSKVSEFEAKSVADVAASITKLGLPESYVSSAEAKLILEEETLKESRAFCRAHRGGYIASGEGDDTRSFTEEQVAARLDQVLDRLTEIGPEASAARKRAAKQLKEDLQLVADIRSGKKKLVEASPSTSSGQTAKRSLKPPPVPGSSAPKAKQPAKTAATTHDEVIAASGKGKEALIGAFANAI